MQCKQAHEYAHIKCNQSKFMSLLPLLVCFSCPRILILVHCSMLLPLCPCPTTTSPHDVVTYLCSPFVINFHKMCASYWYKGLHWVRWLTLQSSIFYGQHNIYWNDTSCRIFDLDTNWWGTSPCHSMCHCWYFLTSTEVNPQAYGITVVAFSFKYSGYRIFHREWRYFF